MRLQGTLISSSILIWFVFSTVVIEGGDGRAKVGLQRIEASVGDDAIGSILLSLHEQMLPDRSLFSENSTTSICERHLEILMTAALEGEQWAIKVLDAWGKPLPSGILKGNVYWLGSYDECVDPLYQESNRSFLQQPIDTQYCAVHSKPGEPVEVRTSLVVGLCLPASCNRKSIITWMENKVNLTGLTENHLRCSNDRANEPNTHWKGTVALITIVSLLLVTVLLGTLIDLRLRGFFRIRRNRKPDDKEYFNLSEAIAKKNDTPALTHRPSAFVRASEPFVTFLAEFSALSTVQRIFTINKREGENAFACLDGIRVLSLCWVILGHSVSSGIYYTSNLLDMQAARRNFVIHALVSGAFAVDTFFVLSGFLTAILFVRQVKKKGLSFRLMASYYIHRYLRLTPAFILVMFVSVYLTPYFGRGPLYPVQQGFEPLKCREGNWWTAFLYIGNFFKSDDLCLGITWYLYNDMQFYWIAPLALIPFAKGKKAVGYFIAVLFVLVSIGSVVGLLLYYPTLMTSDLTPPSNTTAPIFFDVVYMAPWCRIGSYAIGMVTAFVIIRTGRDYHLSRVARILGTFLAVSLAFLSIYWKYFDFMQPTGFSTNVMIAYEALSRPMWSIAIAWLIFLCSTRQGGSVNAFLSSPLWSPFVRLNYATYLTHIIVIFVTVFNQSNPLYYQFMACVINYISHLLFSYTAAIVVVIVFETPFFILEKKLFNR